MTLKIRGRTLNRIAIVDDFQQVREGYAESIQDLEVEPKLISKIGGPIKDTWNAVFGDCDAIITDLKLKSSGYSPENGGALAMEGRLRSIPTVLCTSCPDVSPLITRHERRYIASILASASFELEDVIHGFELALAEIDGDYLPERRPWRTQIEVVERDKDADYLILSVIGRSPDETVKVYLDEFPAELRSDLKTGKLLHAVVNVGADSPEDLYFVEWEPN